MDKIRKMPIGKKEKPVPEARTAYAHKTGIDQLDYLNGMIVRPFDCDPYYSLGVREGSMIQIVGNSGTGKTSLAIKIAANITSKYENSEIYYDDIEGGTDEMRFMNISGFKDTELREKFFRRNVGVYTEQVRAQLLKISKAKKELKEDLMIETDRVDYKGNPIFIYPPTVYIVDSCKVMVPEDLKEDDGLQSNMVYAQIAKANSGLAIQIVPHLLETNIILMFINHLSSAININAYAYKPPMVNYLSQDESIPGGHTLIYLSNNIFKLTSRGKLKEDEDYGIIGYRSKLELIKSRANRAGSSMDFVFDQVRGFSNELSNFEMLKNLELLRGSGRGYFIDEAPEVKFSKKEFLKVYHTNDEFKKTFNKKIKKILKSRVPDPQRDGDDGFDEITETTIIKKKKKKK